MSLAGSQNYNDHGARTAVKVGAYGFFKGFFVSGAIAGAGLYGLARHNAAFRASRPQFKAFLLAIASIGTGWYVAEKDVIKMNQDYALGGHTGNLIEVNPAYAKVDKTLNSVSDFVSEHKYTFVGAAWAGTMAFSLGRMYSNKHLLASQKLVQARVIAQAATVGSLLLMSLFATDDWRQSHGGEDDRNARYNDAFPPYVLEADRIKAAEEEAAAAAAEQEQATQ